MTAREPVEEEGHLVVITGLSGSGKSTVAKCFEDLGYYCIDNLPLPLLRRFLAAPFAQVEGEHRLAIVTDVRAPGFASEFPALWREVKGSRQRATLLFLDASDEALVRRFSETRRPHPLAKDRPLLEGIQRERALLGELRAEADRLFDSSEWSIHEIRQIVYGEFAGDHARRPEMVVSVMSFGFKYGIPYATDLLFDVRFLPNPHFVPGLRESTGQEAAVRDWLLERPGFSPLLDRLAAFVAWLLPLYRQENRSYLSVAIGCTGGRHRSVAVAEGLAGALSEAGWQVQIVHRDLSR